MEHAGFDVSLDWSSVCVVDALGKIVKEAKNFSGPAALVSFFVAQPMAERLALGEYEPLHCRRGGRGCSFVGDRTDGIAAADQALPSCSCRAYLIRLAGGRQRALGPQPARVKTRFQTRQWGDPAS